MRGRGRAVQKLLLGEDKETHPGMLSPRLGRHNFEVVCAIDGPSGVAAAQREKPDLILMDVALGAMDGWEATRQIKAALETADIPIIALTAHALESDRARSVAVGCADFDTKPVDLRRLLQKINACLEAR